MSKQTKTLLIVGAVAIAAWLAWRWYKNRQANTSPSPTGATGTNLNSVAPELIGGSSGPSVGPAVSTPINITLNEASAPPPEVEHGEPMIPANNQTMGAMDRQEDAADVAGEQPGGSPIFPGGPDEIAGEPEPANPGGPSIPVRPKATPPAPPSRRTVPMKRPPTPVRRTVPRR
jgi:hypothetical protein